MQETEKDEDNEEKQKQLKKDKNGLSIRYNVGKLWISVVLVDIRYFSFTLFIVKGKIYFYF